MKWDKDSVSELRKKLKLTQMEFARTLGCRQQTISEWEQGLYLPANAYSQLLDHLARQVELSRPLDVPRQKGPSLEETSMNLPSDEVSAPQQAFDPCLD